jgi:hypothetical protein
MSEFKLYAYEADSVFKVVRIQLYPKSIYTIRIMGLRASVTFIINDSNKV